MLCCVKSAVAICCLHGCFYPSLYIIYALSLLNFQLLTLSGERKEKNIQEVPNENHYRGAAFKLSLLVPRSSNISSHPRKTSLRILSDKWVFPVANGNRMIVGHLLEGQKSSILCGARHVTQGINDHTHVAFCILATAMTFFLLDACRRDRSRN